MSRTLQIITDKYLDNSISEIKEDTRRRRCFCSGTARNPPKLPAKFAQLPLFTGSPCGFPVRLDETVGDLDKYLSIKWEFMIPSIRIIGRRFFNCFQEVSRPLSGCLHAMRMLRDWETRHCCFLKQPLEIWVSR